MTKTSNILKEISGLLISRASSAGRKRSEISISRRRSRVATRIMLKVKEILTTNEEAKTDI